MTTRERLIDARHDLNEAKLQLNLAKQEVSVLSSMLIGAQQDQSLALQRAIETRDKVAELVTEYYSDPSFPTRDWAATELRYAFISTDSPLKIAIHLDRGLQDVTSAIATLQATFKEQPAVLASLLDLSPAETRKRIAKEPDMRSVCRECFTTPHQPTCSQAE